MKEKETYKTLEGIVKKQDIIICYDEQDGYFIRGCGRGQYDHSLEILEKYPEETHRTLIDAVIAASKFIDEI